MNKQPCKTTQIGCVDLLKNSSWATKRWVTTGHFTCIVLFSVPNQDDGLLSRLLDHTTNALQALNAQLFILDNCSVAFKKNVRGFFRLWFSDRFQTPFCWPGALHCRGSMLITVLSTACTGQQEIALGLCHYFCHWDKSMVPTRKFGRSWKELRTYEVQLGGLWFCWLAWLSE